MKRLAIGLIVLLAVLAGTNPSRERHQQAFQQRFQSSNPMLTMLGVGQVGSALIEYRSYTIFSVGRITGEVVSVGVLGKVFARDVDV